MPWILWRMKMKSDHIFWGQPETVFLTLSELAKHSFLIDQLNSEEVIGGDSNFFFMAWQGRPKNYFGQQMWDKADYVRKGKASPFIHAYCKKVIYGLISMD